MELGFKSSAQVFADYFLEKEINEKLSNWSKRYFSVEKVDIKIIVVGEQTEEGEFSSVNEQIMQEEEQKRGQKQDSIQNSDNVKAAEKLFSSKVDKIILNENN